MIAGNTRLLYLRLSGVWTPVGCLTGNGFSEENEVFETTVRDNGGFASVIPVTTSYTVSFDGIVENSIGDPNRISLDRLRTLMRAKEVLEWKLESPGSEMLDFGYGYLTELSDAASVGNFVTFNGLIQGTGGIFNLQNDPATTAPAAPFIQFTIGGILATSVTFTWNVPDSEFPIDFFTIYRNDEVFTTQTYPGSGLPQFYTDSGVDPDSTYAYNVSATDVNGNEGPLSNKIIAGLDTGGNDIPDESLSFIVQESFDPAGRNTVPRHALTQEDNSYLYVETNYDPNL